VLRVVDVFVRNVKRDYRKVTAPLNLTCCASETYQFLKLCYIHFVSVFTSGT
jgi:hypothetical protein